MRWGLGFVGLAAWRSRSVSSPQLVAGRSAPRRLGVIAVVAYFVCGLVVSEVWSGWATEEELQPNIDGLPFDEVLLIAPTGIAAVLIVRHVSRKRGASWDAPNGHELPRS